MISNATRTAIFDFFRIHKLRWSGELDDVEFLGRLFDLQKLPSSDARYQTAEQDIAKHRLMNDDWPDDWVFGDPRFCLTSVGDDETLLTFLGATLHPRVRPDGIQRSFIASGLNDLLAPEGYVLAETRNKQGTIVYHAKASGGVIPERVHKILPLSIRVETEGGLADPVILQGTPLPAKRELAYTTATDNQPEVGVHLLLGESPFARGNFEVGRFQLTGISPSPARVPQILVSLELTSDGNLQVTAWERGKQSTQASKSFHVFKDLSQNDIIKHLKSIEEKTQVDARELRRVEALNRVNVVLGQAETALASGAIGSEARRHVEELVAKLSKMRLRGTEDELRQATDQLDNALTSSTMNVPGSFETIFSQFFNEPQANRSKPTAGAPAQAQSVKTSSHNVFGGGSFSLDTRLCFVLMPFNDPLAIVYTDHIKKAAEQENMRCIRADDVIGVQSITRDIWEQINRARIIIADLTGRNPNVFYELGLAHALEKPVIMLSQSIEDVPFDLKHIRCIIYEMTPRGAADLERKLADTIRSLLSL